MRFRLVLLMGCSALSWVSAAAAQSTEQLTESPSGAVAPPSALQNPPASASQGLDDIVVTARRRVERLQDVPVSVTALSADAINKSGATDVRQLTSSVPNYNGGRNFSVLQPTIRGVGSFGTSLTDESNVALYVDGIYQPNPLSNIVDFAEVERIEVLRGPQGTLFGRNATGGLVNIITPDPSFDFAGKVSAQYGRLKSANEIGGRAFVTGGLSDVVAANLGIVLRHGDGYINDLVRGGHLGGTEHASVRGKLLFEPSDKAKATLTLSYIDQSGSSGPTTSPYKGNTIGNRIPSVIESQHPFDAALNVEPTVDIKQFTAALRMNFDLGPVSLETSTGYLNDEVFQRSDSDSSPVLGSQNTILIKNQAISQELKLLSDENKSFQWIAGFYLFYLEGNSDIRVTAGVAPTYVNTNTRVILPKASVTSFAGFAEGTYWLTHALGLTLGGRYTVEYRDWETSLNGVAPFPAQTFDTSRWTYRASLQYRFSDRANIYATYSTGFKSGVFSTYSTQISPVKPEQLTSAELGLKADLFPWLRTNLALFNYRYKDLQVQARDPITSINLLLNAARAEMNGAELEAEVVATRSLKFRATGSWLDAKYKSFPAAQVFDPIPIAGTSLFGGNMAANRDVSGNRLVRAPRYTMMLSADWTKDLAGGTLNLSGNLFRSAKVYYDVSNRVLQPAYTTVNADISWSAPGDRWKIRVYGRNLSNEIILQQANAGPFGDQATYERPREIGLATEFRF